MLCRPAAARPAPGELETGAGRRADGRRAHGQDLFITGYAENAAMRSGFLAANMSMGAKPFSLDELAAKVSEMIARLDE